MKKFILITVSVFVAVSVFSQRGVELGIRYTPQNTWLFNQADLDEPGNRLYQDITWGQSYGVSAGANFSDRFGLHLNILYSNQGQIYYGELTGVRDEAYSFQIGGQKLITGDVLNPEYTAEVRLDYLQLPVLLKFNTNPDRRIFFTFLVGPQFNFLARARHILNGREILYQESAGFDFETTDLYNSSVMALATGFGFDLNITNSIKLNAHLRFSHDLDDVENKDFTYSPLNINYWSEQRPQTHNLTGGVMVGLTYLIGL